MTDARTLIQKAIDMAGSQKALADAIGTSQQRVSYIMGDAKNIPAEFAVAIDQFTKGTVSRRDLRPDLFGDAA